MWLGVPPVSVFRCPQYKPVCSCLTIRMAGIRLRGFGIAFFSERVYNICPYFSDACVHNRKGAPNGCAYCIRSVGTRMCPFCVAQTDISGAAKAGKPPAAMLRAACRYRLEALTDPVILIGNSHESLMTAVAVLSRRGKLHFWPAWMQTACPVRSAV